MSISDKTTSRMKFRLNFVIFGALLLAAVYMTYQMFVVSVRESEKYQALAYSQQFRAATITANRGAIYDQNGQVLA